MKKFLGLVLAGALCFVVTAKASAQDYMGPKIKVSLGGVSSSGGGSTSLYGGGITYSVMPSDKSDIRLNLQYFTRSQSGGSVNIFTYGADYVWKFGNVATEEVSGSQLYAGLGITGINSRATGGTSDSEFAGDIVAGIDFNKTWNLELKYILNGKKDPDKVSAFQYTVGYNF